MISEIVLPRFAAQTIALEAAAAYPAECCGILVGRVEAARRFIDAVVPVRNAAPPDESHRRFRVPPRKLLAAERSADQQGKLVVGFYHSHPDGDAYPSETDRTEAWAGYAYLIVATSPDGVGDWAAWSLDESSGAFAREPILDESLSSANIKRRPSTEHLTRPGERHAPQT